MTDEPKIDLYIGDNIDVLPTLEETESVDVIYIDPPYNTGKKIFSYEDTRSDWEQFMSARIELCYPLLSDSGVILVSINDKELHTLRLVMDKVFGKKNFLSTIVWRGKGNSKSKFSCGGIDYIVAYAKKRHLAPTWKEKKEHAHLLIKDVQKSKEKGLTVQKPSIGRCAWCRLRRAPTPRQAWAPSAIACRARRSLPGTRCPSTRATTSTRWSELQSAPTGGHASRSTWPPRCAASSASSSDPVLLDVSVSSAIRRYQERQ